MTKNFEPGYKALLVREETKRKLQKFRRQVNDRDLYQERQLATAALEYCLEDPEIMQSVMRKARDVVRLEWAEEELNGKTN